MFLCEKGPGAYQIGNDVAETESPTGSQYKMLIFWKPHERLRDAGNISCKLKSG